MRFTSRGLPRQAAKIVLSASLALLGTAQAVTLNVVESVLVPFSPAKVWKLVGDFRGLAQWHPVVGATDITKGSNNVPGAVRLVTTKDGAKIIEELMTYDGKKKTMRYRILESPLPVRDYVSTLSVSSAEKGTRIEWKSEFQRTDDVDDAKAKEIVAGIYKAGFDGVQDKLKAGASASD